MNRFKAFFILVSSLAVIGLIAAIGFEYKSAKEHAIEDKNNHIKLDKQLDQLEQKLRFEKYVREMQVRVVLKSLPQSQEQKKASRRMYSLTTAENIADSAEVIKLYNIIDKEVYDAVKDEFARPTVIGTDNSSIIINELRFGAGEYELQNRTDIIENGCKVSLKRANANGLAIMGKATPTGTNRPKRAVLNFVMGYIGESDDLMVTSFSKPTSFSADLSIPGHEGSFYHRVWLENGHFQLGVYRLLVYYNGALIEKKTLTLVND